MKRWNRGIWTALLTLLIAACGGGSGGGGNSAPPVVQISVPSVTGLPESAAMTAIQSAGFFAAVTGQISNTVPAGDVISQSPSGGAMAASGTTVNLVISGPASVVVPSVVGDSQTAAAAAVTEAGLQFFVAYTLTSPTVPAGFVISQNIAAGTTEPFGTFLYVNVSSGPPLIMPNVVGDTQAAATTAIEAAGLSVSYVTKAFSATIPVGSVLSQAPLAGTTLVTANVQVSLVVSSFAPVTAPNVVGDAKSAAAIAISAAGLVIGGVAPVKSSTVAMGSVVGQSPAPGTVVAIASAINVSVSSGIQPVETIMHSFTGCATGDNCNTPFPADGSSPAAGLIRGSDGSFYGTTSSGGSLNEGTVFKITPAGIETVLHTFSGGNAASSGDGAVPVAPLIQASDGNFYGTTTFGGAYSVGGTVFRISASGAESVLYSFSGCADPEPCGIQGSADGAGANWLVQDGNGNFYGTTLAGGTNKYGTVFSITPAGTETVLHSFYTGSPGNRDALTPNGLLQGSDGNFYGTAQNADVFKITPAGAESVLYTFPGTGTDGGIPNGNLIQASDGNFYGTTSGGGTYNGGTVFRVTPSGAETVLYSFVNVSGSLDGNSPSGALMQGTDGNFYGTTTLGGAYGQGTVFQVTPSGVVTVLHSFSGCYDLLNEGAICGISGSTDGAGPVGGLIQDSAGDLYGTTVNGGTVQAGTVFKLTGVITSP
jgi:uncharacterized repeat protein (TIGR03803 family)